MKQRLKSYKFWVALSGAVIIFVNALGKVFGFQIDGAVLEGVIMGFCGVLVVLGFVDKPKSNEAKPAESLDAKSEEKAVLPEEKK